MWVPEMPPVPSLRTLDLVETLMPGLAVAVPLPRIKDAVIEASNAVASIVMSEAKKYADTQRQADMESKQ